MNSLYALKLAKLILEEKFGIISRDSQLDPANSEYCGFLNCAPKSEWSEPESLALVYLIGNWSLELYSYLAEWGLSVEDGPSVHETIFVRI